MSNKQSLSFEKCIHFNFHYFKYSLHLFKPSLLFWVLGYSVLTCTRSILCLIDKSSKFCNTGSKEDVAIACAFGRRLGMCTMSAVPTCMANMHVRATLRKCMVLMYLICSQEEKCSQRIYLCVLIAQFSPVKCSETIFHPRASFPDPIYASTHRPLLECIFFKMPRVRAGTLIHYFIIIYTGKCIRRFGGMYAYCRYFIDRKW